ncbi:MAG: T9SS type A sorting domain-containing protein [Bacteroidia bacterium]
MKKILFPLLTILSIHVYGQSYYVPYTINDNFHLYASSCDIKNNKFKGVLNYLDFNNSKHSIILLDEDVNTNQKQFKKISIINNLFYLYDFNSTIKQINDSTSYILLNAYDNSINDNEGYILIKLINNQIVNSTFLKINHNNMNYSDHKILEHNNNLYILFSFHNGAFIVKLDKYTFSEIWVKSLTCNENKTPGFDIKITTNEDIIGVMKDLNSLCVFKINSNGNLIWSKSFGNNFSYRHGKSIFIDNNNFLIAGSMNMVAPLGLFEYLFFSKFDLNNGNLIESKIMQSNANYLLGTINLQYENNNFYYLADFINYDTTYTNMNIRKGVGKFNFNNNASSLIFYSLNDTNYTYSYPSFYSGGNKYCISNNFFYVFDNFEKKEAINYNIPYFLKISNDLNFSCYKTDSTINFVSDTNLFNSEVISNTLLIQNSSITQFPISLSVENFSLPTSDLCPLLSINSDIQTLSEISVYPNPANDKVYFNIPDFNNQPLEIEIIDFSGRTIKKEYTMLSNNYIDVNHLNNGVYFLRISSNNQILYSNKLLIHR